MNEQSPPPPDDQSLYRYVDTEWAAILRDWQRGWASDSRVDRLDQFIEARRIAIFVNDFEADGFDWRTDWIQAKLLHLAQIDYVKNRKRYYEDLALMWREWCTDSRSHMTQVSIEALRSMVLINGAAIIASITILSGQIAEPARAATIAARVTVFFSTVSLIMIAAGHALLFEATSATASRVRGALVGSQRHRRIRGIWRYLRRHHDPSIKNANALIYGSIAVFAVSALISSIVLIVV